LLQQADNRPGHFFLDRFITLPGSGKPCQ
jgi:hypothetical protein